MVKEIPLTQGQVALVDDEMFDFLNQWKWCADYNKEIGGYYVSRAAYVLSKGKKIKQTKRMHRLIMEHVLGRKLKRKEQVDHINHETLDHQLKNLRVVSNRQNNQNKKHKGSSKYPGVCWDKHSKGWKVTIDINNKHKHLGLFDDELEAAKAYERAVRELTGEELVCKMKLKEGIQ